MLFYAFTGADQLFNWHNNVINCFSVIGPLYVLSCRVIGLALVDVCLLEEERTTWHGYFYLWLKWSHQTYSIGLNLYLGFSGDISFSFSCSVYSFEQIYSIRCYT